MGDVHDAEALVTLFRQTLPELYAFVARRSDGDRALAEDVTQEAWLRALEAWRARGAPREPIAWLKTTAANLLRNQRRAVARRGASEPLEFETLADRGSPTRDERGEAVRAGLESLPPAEARLVEEFYLDGRSTRELARERGASERAIEGRLRRARAWLREHLTRRLR